jgi:tetratricopeptide (TPR) repeat protein
MRLGAAALVCLAALPVVAAAQESLSPLPPPVTRSQYRGQWFEFLSAFSENDTAAADKALEGMLRAGRKVGVYRLSDFSRTAVYLGHRAEKQGAAERAGRAYDAALRLDGSNPDAILARLSFLLRHGRSGTALQDLPASTVGFLSTREARVAVLSSLALWIALGIAGMLAGTVLALAVRHFPKAWHDISERASRSWGTAAVLPFALLLLGLPLFVGLGPGWLLLYWGALLLPYTVGRERIVLAGGFVALALVPPLLAKVTAANIEERSPLFVAAIDLDERREDASAEDGLRQAAAVFPEDSDVWYLLGIYAERSGDLERAQSDYARAMLADPADYRPLLNRGNVRFTEGDYGEAIRDYIEAGKRGPGVAAVFYNLSLARGEAYDFEGQAAAIRQAREISNSQVNGWTDNPTLSRVVPAGYSLDRARERMAAWDAQPKSRRLPGHGSARGWRQYFPSWTFAPLAALGLGLLLVSRRGRDIAQDCDHCGRPFCKRCRRWGDPSLYCDACWKLHMKKDDVEIEVQVAETKAMQKRASWRHRAVRLVSLLLPGSHAFASGRPVRAAVVLFLFFSAVGVAVLDERYFDPLTLPPIGTVPATVVLGAVLAAAIWLRAQWGARRVPSGT